MYPPFTCLRLYVLCTGTDGCASLTYRKEVFAEGMYIFFLVSFLFKTMVGIITGASLAETSGLSLSSRLDLLKCLCFYVQITFLIISVLSLLHGT